MKERINRLAKGIIDSEVPGLELIPQKVEKILPPGSRVRGEIMVVSTNGLHLKGLIYSSSPRVQIPNNSFGGLRNRIVYEVNTEYCEHGDIIEGSFYLVTSGGEREIPYSLRIQENISGESLDHLKTAEDFCRLAKKNLNKALEIFEYQDFLKVPFMQEPRCRCLYDGLKGRPGRRNVLEEFLVSLGVKDPVSLTVDTEDRVYEEMEGPAEDVLEIRASGWGYLSASLSTDSSFIELEKEQITDQDFLGGQCRVAFRIRTDRMHAGRNFGQIRIQSSRENFVIALEAERRTERSKGSRESLILDKSSLYQYLSLRLDYETGVYEPALMVNQMAREIDRLREQYRKDDLVSLLQAEIMLLGERREGAVACLEECRSHVLANREQEPVNYCFYEYLRWQVNPADSKKQTLIRLLNQYLEQDPVSREYLFLILIRLDDRLKQNPLELFQQMKSMYQQGSRSPFLYTAACRLLLAHMDLLTGLGDFEVQVLYLAARRQMMTEDMAARTGTLALGLRRYRRIYERLLERIYQSFPTPQILEALCGLLIRGDRRGPQAFAWYELALENQISLTRLYEYFLYSLPDHYGRLMPREVLLYFSYEKDLDDDSRCVLYQNILQYMDPSSDLYRNYTRSMEQFAMEQLFQSRINGRLAVIYQHMIYKDMIDRRVARVLPEILKSCRIDCQDKRMKYVILRCEELKEEQAFGLDHGTAYVPIYSDHCVLLFQDGFGQRYGNAVFQKSPVMENQQELLDQCRQVYPEHPILRLKESARLLEQGIHSDQEAELAEEILSQMNLNPAYARKLSRQVTGYYCSRALAGEEGTPFNCTYLIQMNKEDLDRTQRRQICETLISQNYIREAYDLICHYGVYDVNRSRRMKLCARMILQNLFDEDQTLLELSYGVFRENQYDSVILDYLCEHFNGTVPQMYHLLTQAVDSHVETYDLEERLLGQMMFTGNTEQMDSVFDLYTTRKKTRESVVKAYFTVKSGEYFLELKPVGDRVFSYLEELVNASIEKDKVPTIYLLALTRHYAEQKSLNQEQAMLCRLIGSLLIREGLIFPYIRELSGYMAVPEDIMDKSMIEYRGRKSSRPELLVRILPDEKKFHRQDMRRVYQGIYVMQRVLFQGETMEYQIYDSPEPGGEKTLAEAGRIQGDHKLDGKENSRFAMLNQMGAALEKKDEEGLKKAMEDYLKKAAVLSELFPTM